MATSSIPSVPSPIVQEIARSAHASSQQMLITAVKVAELRYTLEGIEFDLREQLLYPTTRTICEGLNYRLTICTTGIQLAQERYLTLITSVRGLELNLLDQDDAIRSGVRTLVDVPAIGRLHASLTQSVCEMGQRVFQAKLQVSRLLEKK